MDYKEYCIENDNRRFCDVTGIKLSGINLESRPVETIKKNWIVLLGVIAVIIGFLLLRFDYKLFLLVFAFILLFVLLFILGNKYSLECDNNGIKLKQHFQTTHIPCKSVKNVYITKSIRGVIKTYILVIICEDQLSLLREIELPLLCTDKVQAMKFVDNFTIAEEIDENKIKADKKRSLKKIVGLLFRLTCAIIIAWFLISKGIIKMPQ